MNSIGLSLTALMMLIMAAVMAPNIFVLNRGKVLRNIAIWLAIFVGLGLIYQVMHWPPAEPVPVKHEEPPSPVRDNNDGNQGFTPPKEE